MKALGIYANRTRSNREDPEYHGKTTLRAITVRFLYPLDTATPIKSIPIRAAKSNTGIRSISFIYTSKT